MPETPNHVAESPHAANTTDILEDVKRDPEAARDRLISYSYSRLRRLARRMLKDYPGVRQQLESGDVLHPALLRLHRALAEVSLESSKHFWNLAAMKIRQELLGLARFYAAKPKLITLGDSSDAEEELGPRSDSTSEPGGLESWVRFHELINELPEKEREVFYLVWFDFLSQDQAAEVLGVSVRTVRRLWLSARLKMAAWMGGERPS
jgi:RNA polymerase sigma-70 factor (ECF subfamily)